FSGAHGVTIYEVWLSALARRPVEILDIDLETDFDADIVLENRDLGGEYWHLGGRIYPESTLLNPRFDPTLQFRHTGKRVEGILLATGLAPIPPEFRQGQSVPASLKFCDANCHTFKVQTTLYVDRTA